MSANEVAAAAGKPGHGNVRYRTAEQMADRSIQKGAMKTPPLVLLLQDTDRLKRVAMAAKCLTSDGEDEQLVFLRLCLKEADAPCPQAGTAAAFVHLAVRMRWSALPTCIVNPVPGCLWVETGEDGEPTRIGMVRVLHKEKAENGVILRDYFHGNLTVESSRIEYGKVGFWLMPPGLCRPCAERKLGEILPKPEK